MGLKTIEKIIWLFGKINNIYKSWEFTGSSVVRTELTIPSMQGA